jgi:hypothetical protein
LPGRERLSGAVLLCRAGGGAALATAQTPSFWSRQKGYSGW